MNAIDIKLRRFKRPSYSNGLQWFPLAAWQAAGQILWNLLLITTGSVICVIGLNGILVPQNFMSGGFVGISMILHHYFPWLPLAGSYFLLNLPVFCLGWKYVGRRFFLYSVAGMVIFSVAATWTPIIVPVNDKILSAILAGLIVGVGSGLILRSCGSAGGMDILSIILLKKFSLRLGTSILALNVLIISAAAWLFSIESALYSLIYFYVCTQIINMVVNGLSQRKAIHIVSGQWEAMRKAITESSQRSVTLLGCSGGFSGQQMQMLFTVVPFQELSRLKQIIHDIDPNAFVVVSNTLEVMGNRIGNQPHW